ncbi:synaptic vesicle glycoprotein 2B isoform X4 [Drosophila pseudoobscura]|uniref:Synaptic vesicle glycoprotein 2B isoform X3 n=1 Tax=Drosophila pseudoobscura pseudoobscura TaxID=46245 RepID=A0A6I8VCH5_DROPS|nr:synaptic vesicle glycoprotein 2B isoform X3 [Drosophila pseudoobscura]XP_033235607.1 synaptic vesicle glycoprotein 2B isoform X4 [Drosophila pseudoobscura]
MADSKKDFEHTAADFETAIAECGFGLFNILMLFCALPCLMAMVFSASAMSYVMPTAECDLKLTPLDKGLLNAVTFAGMIISAIPWGFIADTMGRRVVLIWGGWIDGLFVLCAALCQDSTQLMVFKFLDGLIICGPFAVLVSYLAEFHGKKHRPYIMLFVGLCVSASATFVPILAYLLLPVHIFFSVGKMNFHTWQIFLMVTALPSLTSGLLHIFLPESPKFLMAQGNYNKALESLQRIYAMNKRQKRETYPVKHLTDATPDRSDVLDRPRQPTSRWERFSRAKLKFWEGVGQLKPMFSSPYLCISLQVYCLHFCQIMCVNSVRLWLPQFFATMHTFELQGINDTSMCNVLEHNSQVRSMDSASMQRECDLVAPEPGHLHGQHHCGSRRRRGFRDHLSPDAHTPGGESHIEGVPLHMRLPCG